MPADPRVKKDERRRRYGRFVYLPWADILSLSPVTKYHQDGALNPDDGGVAREFAPLTERMRRNRFLRAVIRLDFRMLPLSEEERRLAWQVGVHVVQMFARPGIPGVSSPDCLHKDGEPFTYVHLLRRQGVTGGESVVTDNSKRIIYEGMLARRMDSLVVKDSDVFHQVKRIEVSGSGQEGYRTALLVDFTPLKPEILKHDAVG